MRNILVTGSEGLIGKELVALLSKDKNNNVLKADLKLGDDLRHFSVCLSLCSNIDEVYNLVGVKGSPKRTSERPADFFAPIVQFNTNMLEAARIKGVKKFLYVSSIAVENIETDYYPAWAKLTGEKQIETYRKQFPDGMQCCIVRPANIYGRHDNFDSPHAMVVTALINKGLQPGKYLEIWGNGEQVRDFVNSKDAAEGMMKCMKVMPKATINLCSGKGIRIREVADIIAKITKKKLKFDLGKPTGAKSRVMRFDGKKIGWKPKVDIEKGIKEIIRKLM